MNKELIRQAKQTPILPLASQHTTLYRQSDYYMGPCPRCEGNDRFIIFPSGNRWQCRQCASDERGNDVISFVQFINPSYSFQDALSYLLNLPPEMLIQSNHTKRRQQADTTSKWANYRTMAEMAYRRLWCGHSAKVVGYRYLESRGFDISICKPWGVGLHWCKRKDKDGNWLALGWGITLPWLNSDRNVTGINCRLVEPAQDGQRYQRYGYDRNGVFGLHRLLGNYKTLVIIEGELNAIALSHALPNVDIISIGSANYMPSEWLQRASQWQNVLVWADTPNDAQRLSECIEGATWQSSDVDAAELLRRGDLVGMLKG